MLTTKTCPICGTVFQTKFSRKIACSPKCKKERERQYTCGHRKRTPIVETIRESHLIEKNTEARNKNMTYGQLQAIKYAATTKVDLNV